MYAVVHGKDFVVEVDDVKVLSEGLLGLKMPLPGPFKWSRWKGDGTLLWVSSHSKYKYSLAYKAMVG
jgi:hypothetical protein